MLAGIIYNLVDLALNARTKVCAGPVVTPKNHTELGALIQCVSLVTPMVLPMLLNRLPNAFNK